MEKQILHMSDVETLTGFHKTTLRRKWLNNEFPMPTKLFGKTLVWHVETIKQWIQDNARVENES